MSTTTTTKYSVEHQNKEGGAWHSMWNPYNSFQEAEDALPEVTKFLPAAHAFRITRETITTSFTAYQPITNPAL